MAVDGLRWRIARIVVRKCNQQRIVEQMHRLDLACCKRQCQQHAIGAAMVQRFDGSGAGFFAQEQAQLRAFGA